MTKVLLYPLWLRIWHWFNAFLFFILIVSGISMHYSASNDLFLPFNIAMYTHNIAGVLLCIIFVFYTTFNIITGNYKHYIPMIKGIFGRLILQGRYYIYGVFKGEDHPFHTSEKLKFNPLQQLTYFSIMFFLMPIILITGILLMFPELAPENVMGMGGVWPMAVLHIAVGFFLSVFMFGHIYLATHGETITANFKSMIDGYHHIHESETPKLVINSGNIDTYTDEPGIIDIHSDYEIQKGSDTDYNPETKKIN